MDQDALITWEELHSPTVVGVQSQCIDDPSILGCLYQLWCADVGCHCHGLGHVVLGVRLDGSRVGEGGEQPALSLHVHVLTNVQGIVLDAHDEGTYMDVMTFIRLQWTPLLGISRRSVD